MSRDKHQILETITAVSRIITLAFKKEKTKIAIRNHNIILCEPNMEKYYGIKMAQGIDRYWNGDSREDIYILNHVICNFIEWYIIPYKEKDYEVYTGLINMAKYLCVGLKRLQNTYETGTVVGTLQYYIIALTSVINEKYYNGLLYNSKNNTYLDDNEYNMEYSTIFDIEKFKTFWSNEELKSLCDQFEGCFRMPNEKDYSLFNTENSYDDNNSNNMGNFVLPVPRSQKNAIVKGKLVGISEILNTMDMRFKTMVNKSVKGAK
jgi:hypothetical protein